MDETNRTPKLNAALVEAQKAFLPVRKEKVNPFFSTPGKPSLYADLPAILEACLPALWANGIAFSQSTKNSPDGVEVTTFLLHVSGEERASPFWLPVVKKDPQGFGSASTYARRFGAQALLGVAAEADDDGNSHAVNPKAKTASDYTKSKQPPSPRPDAPSPDVIGKLVKAFDGLGVTVAMLEERLGHSVLAVSEAELEGLRAFHGQKKSMTSETAEALAQRREQERGKVAEEKAAIAPAPALFAAYVDKIRIAKTPADVALVVSAAAGAKLTAGDLRALQRTAMDRTLILSDAAAESSRLASADKSDVPL